MTDRELLRLAAKATGMNVLPETQWPRDAKGWFQTLREGDVALYSNETPQTWNPRDDDADAFRLAVKLQFFTEYAPQFDSAITDECGDDNGDQCAATRRAIVRAAAEIGKAMP
jgi:hypothetical protein